MVWIPVGWAPPGWAPMILSQPQYARPTADITRTNWEDQGGGTTDIHTAINEVTPSHALHIRTGLNPTNAVYVAKLTSVTDPESSDDHSIRYWYGKDQAGGRQIDQTIQLRQGYVNEGSPGTLIHEDVYTDVGVGPIPVTITLSGAEADATTTHGDLYARFLANAP